MAAPERVLSTSEGASAGDGELGAHLGEGQGTAIAARTTPDSLSHTLTTSTPDLRSQTDLSGTTSSPAYSASGARVEPQPDVPPARCSFAPWTTRNRVSMTPPGACRGTLSLLAAFNASSTEPPFYTWKPLLLRP